MVIFLMNSVVMPAGCYGTYTYRHATVHDLSAVLRLRTDAAKRYKKVERATAVIWKMLMIAQKNFRKLNAPDCSRESTWEWSTRTGSRSAGRRSPSDPHLHTY